MSDPRGTIHLPARDIRVPSTVSPTAQAVLANPPAESFDFPPLDDPAAWRKMIAERDGAIELHVTEAAGHGGFMGMAPEDQDILREIRQFADLHWSEERR